MALSLGNVCKYIFLAGEDVLPGKGLLQKAATVKRFKYSLLGSALKKQTDITKCQYSFLKTKQILLITIEKMRLRKKMMLWQKIMK